LTFQQASVKVTQDHKVPWYFNWSITMRFVTQIWQFILTTLGFSTKGVYDIDLTAVCMKLMEPVPEGKGWTLDETQMAEKWYRRFLALCKMYPKFPVVPNYYIDSFWHQHILDTKAYAKDCKAVFGSFLHHFPYFGLNGDAQERDDCFDSTNVLYRKHFGEDCTTMAVVRTNSNCKVSCAHCQSERDDRKRDILTTAGTPCQGGVSCNGGGTCNACTVDGRSKYAKDFVSTMVASGCNSGGSGTGCSQGCSRGR
jgi:hypothetical protein